MTLSLNVKFILRLHLIILSLLFLAPNNNLSQTQLIMKGIKTYSLPANNQIFINQLNELSINTVFMPSNVHEDTSLNELLRENRIQRFLIFPVFYDHEKLSKDSSCFAITNKGEKANDSWVKFACPSNPKFQNYNIEKLKSDLQNHRPDGLSIDFIRHFAFWEMIYEETDIDSIPNSCFCSNCQRKFQSEYKFTFPENLENEKEIYSWIKENKFDEWIDWKCRLITSHCFEIINVAKSISPNIKINIHAVPWRTQDFNGAVKSIMGQDISKISDKADYISPMTYSHMLKREPEWINSVVSDLDKKAHGKIIPSIQVSKSYLTKENNLEDFKQQIKYALKAPSKGIVFWNWEMLINDSYKFELVKKILKIN